VSVLRHLLVLLFAAAVVLTRGGVSEAVENAVHAVVHGHSAHSAESADDHSHRDVEHGCAGGVHVCPCCGQLPMACGAECDLGIAFAPVGTESLTVAREAVRAEGASQTVYRPPMLG
jgi:hypothetical protein